MDGTVPIALQNIIMRMCEKAQSDRYSNANELLHDLRRIKFSRKGILEDTRIIESPTQICQ